MSSEIFFRPNTAWDDFIRITGYSADADTVAFSETDELSCTDERRGAGKLVVYRADDRSASVSVPFTRVVFVGDVRKHSISFFAGGAEVASSISNHGSHSVRIGGYAFINWDKLVVRVHY